MSDSLRIANLEVRYGDLVGVADVSLEVKQGTVVALLETETLNEPEIELLRQQVVVEGPGPATLLHPLEGIRGAIHPPVTGPKAEARVRGTVPVAPK